MIHQNLFQLIATLVFLRLSDSTEVSDQIGMEQKADPN